MRRLDTKQELDRMIQEAVGPLLARIAELETELAKLKKDSSTSSKPPSSDITKPPRPPQPRKGRPKKPRPGGQPGHARHERNPFPAEEVAKTWVYEGTDSSLTVDWEPWEEFRTIQQVELLPKRFEVVEHQARLYRHRVIQSFASDVLQLKFSTGQLVKIVGKASDALAPAYEELQTATSPKRSPKHGPSIPQPR